jgi:hypothetical protein
MNVARHSSAVGAAVTHKDLTSRRILGVSRQARAVPSLIERL